MISLQKSASLASLLLMLGPAGPVHSQNASGVAINAGLSGSWANPDIPGQGLFLDVDPAFGAIFVAWFTYQEAETESKAVIGYPRNQWFVAQGPVEQGDSSAMMDIIQTKGGIFDDPAPVSLQTIGSMELNFLSCTEAEMYFNFDDGGAQGHIRLTRITPADVCQTLATQNQKDSSAN